LITELNMCECSVGRLIQLPVRSLKVKVHIYSHDIPDSSADFHKLPPSVVELTLLRSHLTEENAVKQLDPIASPMICRSESL
jgi:hypothetical protein